MTINTIEKIKQIHCKLGDCSAFEQKFISDNHARIERFGDVTKLSEKQTALVDRIFKERVEEGKVHTAKTVEVAEG